MMILKKYELKTNKQTQTNLNLGKSLKPATHEILESSLIKKLNSLLI